MKTGAGWQQDYHAQAAVDGKEQLVVAAEVSVDANDHGKLLHAMVGEVAVVACERLEAVLADAGYASGRELARLEYREVEGYGALGRGVRRPDSTRRPASVRMAQRLNSREGRAVDAQRKWLAEAPISWIKHVLGFRRFSVRGEWLSSRVA